MDRETIVNRTLDLPAKTVSKIAEDSEIWEENDGEAHFKVTHESVPEKGIEFYSMSVSGPMHERTRIKSEFFDALGEPDLYHQQFTGGRTIEFLGWLIKPKINRQR